jgi:hypothetical protein
MAYAITLCMLLAFARNLKRKTRRLRAHGRAGSALHTAAAEMMSDGHDDAVRARDSAATKMELASHYFTTDFLK